MPVKIGLFAGALFATASSAYAGAILIPPNLNPGDTYRIIFVTDSTINATSANAADYNAFVTTAAQNDPGLAALQTTWTALVSTGSTGVFTNTGLSSSDSTTAFYNTQGQLIAQGANGGPNSLYGGSHLAGIFDPNGAAPLDTIVWTGTMSDGSTSRFYLGISSSLGGLNNLSDASWTSADTHTSAQTHTIYGLSGILTAAATPEPSTFTTTALAAAALLLFAIARKHKTGSA